VNKARTYVGAATIQRGQLIAQPGHLAQRRLRQRVTSNRQPNRVRIKTPAQFVETRRVRLTPRYLQLGFDIGAVGVETEFVRVAVLIGYGHVRTTRAQLILSCLRGQ